MEEEEPELTKHIDESQIRYPNIAMQEANREIYRLGKKTANMLSLSRKAVLKNDVELAKQVVDTEYDVVNPLCIKLENFLNELILEDLSYEQTRQCYHLKEMVFDIERVSDMNENLAWFAQEEINFGSGMTEQLDDIFQRTLGHMMHAFTVAPVFDVTIEPNSLNHHLFFRLAERYYKEYLITRWYA